MPTTSSLTKALPNPQRFGLRRCLQIFGQWCPGSENKTLFSGDVVMGADGDLYIFAGRKDGENLLDPYDG